MAINDVLLIRTKRNQDRRGYFAETYVQRDYEKTGITNTFVQDNQSYSVECGTARGLHFQIAPFEQAKLVRVLRGRILDVVVDLRRSSPSYGQYVYAELGADEGDQIFIPVGFAHGFCTLAPCTEVSYKVDAVFSAAHDRGVNAADPDLAIRWPKEFSAIKMSDKDRALPMLRDLRGHFN
jgi:dTDP-4-dehydrorhamnose 3,5-epimerase